LAFNFAFITLDIYIAHFLSQFLSIFIKNGVNPANTEVLWGKFIPLIFSPVYASFLLITAITDIKSTLHKKWIKMFSYLSIIIGILGFYFHVAHKFHFSRENLAENFIFGPPALAPVMFILLALYVLSILSEDTNVTFNKPTKKSKFLIYLTAIQFIMLVFLSAFEHSHNYFASIYEWIPPVIGFFIFSFLLFSMTLIKNDGRFNSNFFTKIYFLLMIFSILAGVAGFGFHVFRNATLHTHGISNYFINTFIGSPVFAPLLFTNGGIFGVLVYFKVNKNS